MPGGKKKRKLDINLNSQCQELLSKPLAVEPVASSSQV